MANELPAPFIERGFTLNFKGDWGSAHMHRVCGWLSQEVYDHTGKGTRIAIWTGRGAADEVEALRRGEVDLAIATPASFMRAALEGKGLFARPFPELRSLGTVPQTDRLIMAVRAEMGVRSFSDLRAKQPPLVIATACDDRESIIGFAARELMELSGVSRSTLASWGGRYLEYERPSGCLAAMHEGTANALIFEAVMTERWQAIAQKYDLAFLEVEDATLAAFADRYDWPAATMPANYMRGMDTPLRTLDFSDFAIMVRSDLPEDLAYLLAWCLCERREILERQYRHIPLERSPITYPLEPAKIARTALPLHPGAKRYYQDAGIL